MTQDTDIREKQDRMINVFRKRPDAARSTIRAGAVVGDGLRCDFTQGDTTAVMDMPDIMGGANSGPTPGFFARAGICGCVSIGIKQTAIGEGLDFRKIEVDLEMDFDDGAAFGLGSNSAAPLETRLVISIDTDEPDDIVQDLVDRLLERDPYFLALRDAQNVTTDLTVTR